MNKIINNIFKLFALVAILSITGCASSTNVRTSSQIEVPEGKAVIHFFRPSSMWGAAIKFHVHTMDGKPVGFLASGDSFSITVEPGTHQYWSTTSIRNDVVVPTEAGKVYYVKVVVKVGAGIGRPVLELVSGPD